MWVGGEQTGPFSCCFSIGYSWPHPVPHGFKTKQKLTSLSLSLSLAVSLSRQSRNSPPFLLLLPHFVFEAGRGRSWALVHFLFAVHEINPYKNAKLGNLLFLSL